MGFYSGVGPRLCRVVADVALTFSIFGALKRQIQQMLMNRWIIIFFKLQAYVTAYSVSDKLNTLKLNTCGPT